MAVDNDEHRSDRKEQKHKHKHRERDREHKDKDRERERESGADKHALERGSSHRSDRDREHKRDRRDRHRDQGEDRSGRHTGTPGDLGRGSPGADQDPAVPRSMSGVDAAETSVSAGVSNTRAEPAPEPAAIKPQVQDSGGEVSMSVEETNRSAE